MTTNGCWSAQVCRPPLASSRLSSIPVQPQLHNYLWSPTSTRTLTDLLQIVCLEMLLVPVLSSLPDIPYLLLLVLPASPRLTLLDIWYWHCLTLSICLEMKPDFISPSCCSCLTGLSSEHAPLSPLNCPFVLMSVFQTPDCEWIPSPRTRLICSIYTAEKIKGTWK